MPSMLLDPRPVLFTLWLTIPLGGCTAVKAQAQLFMAQSDLAEAREQGAQEDAAYEHAMAKEYLAKAREEANN